MNEYIMKTLELADADLAISELAIQQNQDHLLRNACYHAQQAAEKYLKAYLAYNKIHVARTHDLNYLLKEVKINDSAFPDFDFTGMEDYGTVIRYADYSDPEPDRADAEYALHKAQAVRQSVRTRMGLGN